MQAEALIDALEEAGCAPRAYSGRFMYGAQCVAFRTDDLYRDIAAIAVTLMTREVDGDAIIELFGGLRSDHLGRSTIAYFPHIAWPMERVEEIEQPGG